MEIFIVNTDTVDGTSRHRAWIEREVVVTDGKAKYRKSLSRVRTGDTVVLYENGIGIVALGTALDDGLVDVQGEDRLNKKEVVEYHKRVKWELDLRANPITRAELIQLLGQGPMQAVQMVVKGKQQLLNRLILLQSGVTSDIGEYIRLADELWKSGRVARPTGIEQPKRTESQVLQFYRDPKVRAWVLQRAEGRCELCASPAPFFDHFQTPYLESHHIITLASGGPDTPKNTAALCPNCHRELHVGLDRVAKSRVLSELVLVKEARQS